MASSTRTEAGTRSARRPAPDAAARCGVLAALPAPVTVEIPPVLAGLGIATVVAASPTDLRDALYDRRVVVVFVHFGRDPAAGAATCRTIRRHPADRSPAIIALIDPNAANHFPVDCGADDAILLPLLPAELALRVRLALWRQDMTEDEAVIKLGDLVVDVGGMRVRLQGVPVDLTYKEFALLRYFLANPGVALPRSRILDAVWGEDYFGGDRTVDIHVRRLRAKLPPLAARIETVHGVGYRCTLAPGTVG